MLKPSARFSVKAERLSRLKLLQNRSWLKLSREAALLGWGWSNVTPVCTTSVSI